jgi:hypothetical protein
MNGCVRLEYQSCRQHTLHIRAGHGKKRKGKETRNTCSMRRCMVCLYQNFVDWIMIYIHTYSKSVVLFSRNSFGTN